MPEIQDTNPSCADLAISVATMPPQTRMRLVLGAGFFLLFANMLYAADVSSLERRIRAEFPSIAIESSAHFETVDAIVGGKRIPALRARFEPQKSKERLGLPARSPVQEALERLATREADPEIRVAYPLIYNDSIVAELREQRVVLRPVGAYRANAQTQNGKIIYEGTYDSVDTIEIAGRARSEELLFLRDKRAPLVYDYEIVEMQGVAGVVIDGGDVRFLPKLTDVPSVSNVAEGRFVRPTPSLQIERPWLVDASGRRSESQAHWEIVGDGAMPKTLRLTIDRNRNVTLAYPLIVDPSFTSSGSMATERVDHAATLLPNGMVLVTGGYDGVTTVSSAELYDPANGTFTPTGSMTSARRNPTATLLPNGKVLVTGGSDDFNALSSAEIYDAASGTFSPTTGAMSASRFFHTATLLPNGKVLLAGGDSLGSAELFDPISGTFSLTGSMTTPRTEHTATLLPNGKVLIAGGYNAGFLSSAELYDPASGTFSPTTGPLATARNFHTATLLANGKVLIAGGVGTSAGLSSAELYDPSSATFGPAGSLLAGRYNHTATLLPNGKVLIVGGHAVGVLAFNSAELYDPATSTFSATGAMANLRYLHTATLLPSGKVLIAGGEGFGILSSTEVYSPVSGTFGVTGSPVTVRFNHTATLLPNGKVLVAGGVDRSNSRLSSAELYDPINGTFSPSKGTLATARYNHTATLLPNGKVLIAGGLDSSDFPLDSAELYDPISDTFSVTSGNMNSPRKLQTATLLPTGKVLIAGGANQLGPWSSAELFDPTSGTFALTGLMESAREDHTATLLTNGRVLIAGGDAGATVLNSAELYDPASGRFSATSGPMATPREFHSATLLPSGKVLVAGGDVTGSSAELYDPVSNTFSATGSLITGRCCHAARLLPDGRTLIVGGQGSAGILSSAELYDPASHTFNATASMAAGRVYPTATLLATGTVLVNGWSSSAELFSPTTDSPTFQPTITSLSSTLSFGTPFSITGSLFRGDSEASSGSTSSSPTNYPLVSLLSIEGSQFNWLVPDSRCSFPATCNFWDDPMTLTVSNLPPTITPGWKLLTVTTDGVSSVSGLVSMTCGPPVITAEPSSVIATLGAPATFSVAAQGGLSYQWRQDGLNIPGATSASYTSPPINASYSGSSFDVVVTGGCGTVVSTPAILTIADSTPPTAKLIYPSGGEYWLLSTGSQPIVNGGFETGSLSSWTTGGAIVPTASAAQQYSGSYSAVLGAYQAPEQNGDSFMYQTVTIPSNATSATLSFWYKTSTTDTITFDWQEAQIRSSSGAMLSQIFKVCQIAGWIHQTVDLSPYKGQTIQIYFNAHGDGVGDLTYMYVDDVTVDINANTQTITWSMSDNVEICQVNVSLLYSNDGGSTYTSAPGGGGLPATLGPGGSCRYPGLLTTNLTYTVPITYPSGKSGSLYKIQLTVTDQAGNATSVSSNPFFFVQSDPQVKTLILSNVSRMVARQGISATDASLLNSKLQDLANHPLVQGHVVDLGGVAAITNLYSAWDASPSNPDSANAVLFNAGGIHDYLTTNLLVAYPAVKYLVLVGDDRIIPIARIQDRTVLFPEMNYPAGGIDITTATTVGQALAAGKYLTDDALAVRSGVTMGQLSGSLFLPDLSIGRLVETPHEIVTTIATFIGQNGLLDLTLLDPVNGHKVLITGYDFLTNPAVQMRTRWKNSLGVSTPDSSLAPVDGTLVGGNWGLGSVSERTTALSANLAGNGGAHYGIVGLAGHATHYEEGVPGTSAQDIEGLSTANIYGAVCADNPSVGGLDLSGSVVYSLGCHAGLSVPGSCRNDADHSLDLPQTMLNRGAVAYIGNSGYGWGLKFGIGYGGRLAQIFTEEITSAGTFAVGDMVRLSKQRYYLETPRYDPYDEKTMMQWMVYGLPMYTVKTGITPSATTGEPNKRVNATVEKSGSISEETLGAIRVRRQRVTANHALTTSATKSSRAGTLALPAFLTQLNLSFDFTASGVYEKHDSLGNVLPAGPGCTDANGCYYTLNGLTDRGTGSGDLPIEPYLIYDSRLSGTSQHGVLWAGGTYDEESNWTPVIAQFVSNGGDASNHGPAPRVASIRPTALRVVPGGDAPTCLVSDLEVNSLTLTAGEAVKNQTTDLTYSITRRYRTINLDVFYYNNQTAPANNCDRTGPSLGPGPFAGQYHQVNGSTISWAVPATDASGVWRVLVVYNANTVDGLGRGTWTPLDLTDDGTGTFRGTATVTGTSRATYVIQAVDNSGNITWLDYANAQLPASGVPLGVPNTVDAAVSFAIGAPTGVVAVASTPSSVAVNWNSATSATSYDVYRSASGTNYLKIGSSGTASYIDNTATANMAYLYAVKAIDAGSNVSAMSSPDLATTVIFTDPTLTLGSTPVRAVHITELRTAVNAVRTLAGLATYPFTDPTITPGVTKVNTVHITDLRAALNAARLTLNLTLLAYTDPALTPDSTVIKAVHIIDLRRGVQ